VRTALVPGLGLCENCTCARTKLVQELRYARTGFVREMCCVRTGAVDASVVDWDYEGCSLYSLNNPNCPNNP
jgi:hypothetical protein